MTGYDPSASGPWSDTDAYPGRPPLLAGDLAHDIAELLGDRIRLDDEFACRCWGSLANVDWLKDGEDHGFSFRQAGSVLAAIRGTADKPYCYMEFYCCTQAGVIDPEFNTALTTRGWTGRTL